MKSACRVLSMTALNDQHYGGLIIWLPGTLASFARHDRGVGDDAPERGGSREKAGRLAVRHFCVTHMTALPPCFWK